MILNRETIRKHPENRSENSRDVFLSHERKREKERENSGVKIFIFLRKTAARKREGIIGAQVATCTFLATE